MAESVEGALIAALMTPQAGPNGTSANDALLPVNQVVRLLKDVAEWSLCKGELGVIVSIWFAPIVAYEVEFYRPHDRTRTRVLVLAAHLQAEPAIPGSRPENRWNHQSDFQETFA